MSLRLLYPLNNFYENTSCQCTDNLKLEKWKKSVKNFDMLNSFALNIVWGYTLEPPRRGGSNVYLQSMFWIKNKKNRYSPVHPSFAI